MNLSYSNVIKILAGVNGVEVSGLGAFKARLRRLQVEGIPEGANPGKGKRVDYSLLMLFEMAIAIELGQCGWSARESAALIQANRMDFYMASLFAIAGQRDHSSDPFVLISPEALRAAESASVDASMPIGAVSFVTRGGLLELFSRAAPVGAHWRWSVIDLQRVLVVLLGFIEDHQAADDDVIGLVMDEYKRHNREMTRFLNKTIDRD